MVRLAISKRAWRRSNKHNKTKVGNLFDSSLVSVGVGTYGIINLYHTGDQGKLKIGNFCSIAPDVSFVMNNEHRTDCMSTYPFKVMSFNAARFEAASKGGITVADDVWIGYRATILDGVTIARGAVVAAGAVVTKDVRPYSIVGGCPAKCIGYRFPEDIVDVLQGVDYERLPKRLNTVPIDVLYTQIKDVETAVEIVARLNNAC